MKSQKKSDSSKETPQPHKDEEMSVAEMLLISEVDDEMRAQKLQSLWQRFGSWLVGGCILVVLATVAYQLYASHQISRNEEITKILLDAQKMENEGQTEQAIALLQTAADSQHPASRLATLKRAYKLELQGENEQAQALINKLASDITEGAFTSLGRLETGQELKKGQVFYAISAEMKVLELMQENNIEEARKLLQSLLDNEDLVPSQHQRLRELLSGLPQAS